MNQQESAYARELFQELFGELSAIGLDSSGATTRLAWTEEAADAGAVVRPYTAKAPRAERAGRPQRQPLGLGRPAEPRSDGDHRQPPRTRYAEGGRFDGALGVLSGLVALHLLLQRGSLNTPMAVLSFADEEGGRFDTPTFGSRALLGSLDVQAVLGRRDRDGVPLGEALSAAGLEPAELGADPERLKQIGVFVEVHIEQDTLLTERDLPLALGTKILPHGRWRIDLGGEANHAGTTPLAIRRDPMLTLAAAVTAARRVATELGALATIGKLEVSPNATNAIAEHVSLWLDVRAQNDEAVEHTVRADLRRGAGRRRRQTACSSSVSRESFVGAVQFSPQLRARVAAILAERGIEDVPMATGAGHDAGALANAVPTAMLFVRSATGASHSRRELASIEDCEAGIGALTEVLAALAEDLTDPNDMSKVDDDG